MMKLLSICIPNYNRPNKFAELLQRLAQNIREAHIEDLVEICISDDHSIIDPSITVKRIQQEYKNITFIYSRNEKNMGMDYNFLNSVKISEGEFCWIIGNDDLPVEGSISFIIDMIRQDKKGVLDILVTPFDQFDENDNYVLSVYPLKKNDEYRQIFNTRDKGDFKKLVSLVNHNSALFGFLSNVVFRKKCWIRHGDMFSDKMNSIFIQMYMNIQTLFDGANYYYIQQKIIKNFADNNTNSAFDRWGRIAVGLADVVTYFFEGQEKSNLLDLFVSGYICSEFWELPDGHAWKRKMTELNMVKTKIYNQFYICRAQRSEYYAHKNVVIFGAGEYGTRTQLEMEQYHANIIGFCDNDMEKRGKIKSGYRIYSFAELLDMYKDRKAEIVIANNRAKSKMAEQLINYGVDAERISIII